MIKDEGGRMKTSVAQAVNRGGVFSSFILQPSALLL